MSVESTVTVKSAHLFFAALGAAIQIAIGKQATMSNRVSVALSAIAWAVGGTEFVTAIARAQIQEISVFSSLNPGAWDSFELIVAFVLGLCGGMISVFVIALMNLLTSKLSEKVNSL